MKRAAKAPVVWHIEELRSLLISMLGDSRFSSTRIIIGKLKPVFHTGYDPINKE